MRRCGRSPSVACQPSFGAESGLGAPGSSPERSGPSSSSAPSAAGGVGIWPVCRTGWRSLEIAERSSYAMPFSSVRLTRTPGIVTRRPAIETCPWTMNCRACRGVKARPFRNVSVWRRRDKIASTSRARTSSSLVPSSGRSPSRPSRRKSCSRSFSACLSPVRTRACSSRARCRNRRKTYWERHNSFLFLSPYFFKSSFSALMRSASHGWDGRSNFARENFGSPNDSLLLLRRFLLFRLRFLLGGGFLGLLGLRGLEGGLLRHPDRQARSAVRPRALPADLLARLMADALVRPDHFHQVDVVPQPDFDLRPDEMQIEAGLPIFRSVHHPGRAEFAEIAQGRLDLVRLLLREIAESLGARHAGQVGDGFGHADPDARDGREGVPDRPGPGHVRVRHPDDVAEVLVHALEFLRRPRGLRLFLRFLFLLRGAPRLLGRRGGGRAFGFGRGLLVRHSVPWVRGAPNSERYLSLRSVRLGGRLLRPSARISRDQAQLVHIDVGREVAARIAIPVCSRPRISLMQRLDGQPWEPDPRCGDVGLSADGQVQTSDRSRVRRGRNFQIDVRATPEAGILLAFEPPTPAVPDGHVKFPLRAHPIQGDFRGERTPRRIARNPVPDVGRLVIQHADDLSLQVPATLVAREQETLGPHRFVAAPQDRPSGRANLPGLGRLTIPQRLPHRERVVLEADRTVEPLGVDVLQTGRQDEPIGPALAGQVLDELEQAAPYALTTIRSGDKQVRQFGVRGRVQGRHEAQTREAQDVAAPFGDDQGLGAAGLLDSPLHGRRGHGFAEPLPVESLEQGDEFRRIGRGDLSACRRLRHQGGLFVVRRTLNPLLRFTMSAAPNVAAIRCRRESAPWRVRATSHRLPPSSKCAGASLTIRSTTPRPARMGGLQTMWSNAMSATGS